MDSEFPEDVSENFRDLIHQLLEQNPTKRLGNLKDAGFGIKHHKFFGPVPWSNLLRQRIKAPYKPTIDSNSDTSNFRIFDNEPLKTSAQDLHSASFANFPLPPIGIVKLNK